MSVTKTSKTGASNAKPLAKPLPSEAIRRTIDRLESLPGADLPATKPDYDLMCVWAQKLPGYGTVGCIVGETLLANGYTPRTLNKAMSFDGACIKDQFFADIAADLLGLNNQGLNLFYDCDWPTKLRKAYAKAETLGEQRTAMVQALRHFTSRPKYTKKAPK